MALETPTATDTPATPAEGKHNGGHQPSTLQSRPLGEDRWLLTDASEAKGPDDIAGLVIDNNRNVVATLHKANATEPHHHFALFDTKHCTGLEAKDLPAPKPLDSFVKENPGVPTSIVNDFGINKSKQRDRGIA